jgi:uncharacterized protein DUF4386
MTRKTSARIAGFTFLFYIAVAFPEMVLFGRATSGEGIHAKLASIAQHTTEMRVSVLLTMLSSFSALVLAVTLYAITRDEDRELALLGFACRLGEGVVYAIPLSTLGLLWLVTAVGPNAPDPAAADAIGNFLLNVAEWTTTSSATLFAVGSTIFSYLLLRGRMIPRPLAWLGLVGSALLIVALPLQLAEFLRGPITQLVWIPVALFELTLAPWLLIKGVRTPQP